MRIHGVAVAVCVLVFSLSVAALSQGVTKRAENPNSCIASCECWSADPNGYSHGSHNHTLCGYISGSTGQAWIGANITVRPFTVHGVNPATYTVAWQLLTRSGNPNQGQSGSFDNIAGGDGTYPAKIAGSVAKVHVQDDTLDPLQQNHAGERGQLRVTVSRAACSHTEVFSYVVAYWLNGPRDISVNCSPAGLQPEESADVWISYTPSQWVGESEQLTVTKPPGECSYATVLPPT